MKKLLALLSLVLVSTLVTAQSVLITPGAQSINGDSTSQDQLNVFGNGLLVGPKVKLTEDDPASNVHIMSCASVTISESLAGTLKDPNGDADYAGGLFYDCNFVFYTNNPLFQTYQIDFESLDTEADGDTVYVLDYSTAEVLGAYSGNDLPTSLIVSQNVIRIKFKTDNDANVGTGFVLKWKAILKASEATAIQNYSGEGLVYDVASNALWAGKHGLSAFENRGNNSTALGRSTTASGNSSTALGLSTAASGNSSTALGYSTAASGDYSTALGRSTRASGVSSTALGRNTRASGDYSTALGYYTESSGEYSTALGNSTAASGFSSTALGNSTAASGDFSTALGNSTAASGNYSTALGRNTTASDDYSTALGYSTAASGEFSTALGYSTAASGNYSTALGGSTTASGNYSTALGRNTTASGFSSTAQGYSTAASGNSSTAQGYSTAASGNSSTALGYFTTTSGDYSTALGTRATTNGHLGAMVLSDYVSNAGDSLSADAPN